MGILSDAGAGEDVEGLYIGGGMKETLARMAGPLKPVSAAACRFVE
jgi:hypothetical protein